MSTNLSLFKNVTLDNNHEILSQLGQEDLRKCCQVSKEWEVIASNDKLWIRLFPGIDNFVKVDVKKYIASHTILGSMDDIIDRFKKIVDKVSVKGSFTCSFLLNPDCHLDVELQLVCYDWLSRKPELKERCIFIKELQSDERGNQVINYLVDETRSFGRIASYFFPGFGNGFKENGSLPVAAVKPYNTFDRIRIAHVEKSSKIIERAQLRNKILAGATVVATTALALWGGYSLF